LSDTRRYQEQLDAEAFGHMTGLGLGRLYAAPGKNTMATIDAIVETLGPFPGSKPCDDPRPDPKQPERCMCRHSIINHLKRGTP